MKRKIFAILIVAALVVPTLFSFIPFGHAEAATMSVRVASQAGATFTTGTNLAIAKPAGTAEGDLMVIAIAAYRGGNTIALSSVPDGWSLLTNHLLTPNSAYWLYYKLAGDSEPGSYTWGFTRTGGAGTSYVAMVCEAVVGGSFDPTDPIDTYSTLKYGGFDTTVRASMTTNWNNEGIVFFAMTINSNHTFTPPNNPGAFAEDKDYNYATFVSIEAAHYFWGGQGATGNIDATASAATTQKRAFAVALTAIPDAPVVTTGDIDTTDISYLEVDVEGEITDTGRGAEDTITARGFAYDVDSGVPYAYNYSEAGTFGLGEFATTITGLNAGTTYYVAAFAANANSTAYGAEKSFTTLPAAAPSNIRAYSEDDRIAIAFTRGEATEGTIVRYAAGGYPSSITDGILAANTTYGSAAISGLEYGRTYYIALWGYWSVNLTSVAYALPITIGAGAASTTPGGPTTPGSWFLTTDYTVMSSAPLYAQFNNALDAASLPRNTGWRLIAIGFSVLAAIITLAVSKSGSATMFVLAIGLLISVIARLLPGWTVVFVVLVFIGATKMTSPARGGVR